ncbi:MAG: hypothetical protein ACR2OO_12845 [Thermomicrobiales bacterium]
MSDSERTAADGGGANASFDLYDRLDRYEELLEDMAELDVASVDDVERRIIELNERIDALETDAGASS